MEVKVGDQVLYGKYAGQEIQVDGVDYLIMKQNDILAISTITGRSDLEIFTFPLKIPLKWGTPGISL